MMTLRLRSASERTLPSIITSASAASPSQQTSCLTAKEEMKFRTKRAGRQALCAINHLQLIPWPNSPRLHARCPNPDTLRAQQYALTPCFFQEQSLLRTLRFSRCRAPARNVNKEAMRMTNDIHTIDVRTEKSFSSSTLPP